MTSKIKSEISRQLIVQIASSKVLSNLRVFDLIIDVNFEDSKNPRIINSMFKTRDIYNLKAELRRNVLSSLTSVQALIRELDQDD